jgi:hypothetical protein
MPDADRRRIALRGGCLVVALGLGAAILIPALNGTGDLSSPPDMPASLGPGNDCYYVRTPGEAANMHILSKCPRNDVPAQAPRSWVIRYYPFYDSPWYQHNVVPQSDQADYAAYMSNFGAENATEIAEEAPAAQYDGGAGTIVTGANAGVSRDGTSIDEHGGRGGEGGHGDGGR